MSRYSTTRWIFEDVLQEGFFRLEGERNGGLGSSIVHNAWTSPSFAERVKQRSLRRQSRRSSTGGVTTVIVSTGGNGEFEAALHFFDPVFLGSEVIYFEMCANDMADVGAIWRAAIDRYKDITQVDIGSIEAANSVEDVLSEIDTRKDEFKRTRHDGSKTDKFRSLISRSLKSIETVSEVVAQGASNSFPPSMAIFTAVRHLLKTANSVSADFDKVAEFFGDVESYLKRLKTIEEKIPPVPELEFVLSEVLTSVLILCGICTKYTKKRRFAKALRNLVSGEDVELASAYDKFHQMVKREQELIVTLTFVEVGEANRSLKQSERVYKQLGDKDVLEDLSAHTFLATQKDKFGKHHDGTCQWVLSHETFQRWLNGTGNSSLWCCGDPGSGKTILTSIIINDVDEKTRGTGTAIAFMYCNYKDTNTHSELALLSSIARQLTAQIEHIPPVVKEFRDQKAMRKRDPTGDEWVTLIKSLGRFFCKTIIIVDALDECPEYNRDEFFRFIKMLDTSIRFMFTSRPHITLPVKLSGFQRIHIAANPSDLQIFLDSEISKRNIFQKFVIQTDSSLQAEVIEKIITKSKGIFRFLLAYHHVEKICQQPHISGVRKTLISLPDNIFDYYHEAMERIEQQETVLCDLAKDALSFITHAQRPLHVNELRHALGVWANDTDFEETQCVDDKLLISICTGLVKIDETRDVVELVHQTLQEYFKTFPERLFEDPDSKIARACLVYLSFDAFGSGPCADGKALQMRLENHVFFPYAAHFWGYHVRNSQDDYTNLILRYLNDNNKLLSAVQVLYATSPRVKDWFNRYPKQIGPLHIAAWWGLTRIIKILLSEGFDTTICNSRGESPFFVAAQNDQREAVELFLDYGNDINERNFAGETALMLAAKNGSKDLVKVLLLRGAELITDHEGWSAINWAVVGGKCEVLDLLLAKARSSTGIDTKNQALFLAAEEGHKGMVEMLLESGSNINAKDSNGSTALDFAVSGAHVATVELLLFQKANVNSTDSGGNIALHWAATHEPITRLLLKFGALVNTKNCAGQTALFWTAQDSSPAVARLLLESGADSDLTDKNGATALHIAALQGHEQIAALLLQKGANPNIQDKDGWTPLYGAAVQEHATMVSLLLGNSGDSKNTLDSVTSKMENSGKRLNLKRIAEDKRQGSTVTSGLRVAAQEAQLGRLRMMLEKGADVDAKDPAGYTALELAAFLGHKQVAQLLLGYGANGTESVVPLLIEYGADVNAETYGMTPLMLAATIGNPSINLCLLEAKADLNARDCSGQTALHLAVLNERTQVARMLLDAGAASDISDDQGRTAFMLAVDNMGDKAAALLFDGDFDIEADNTTMTGSSWLFF
ncbi:hypothetical protein N7508_007151 [Penicillium antarcticum]|uniref:uncharacterized protein n=1 Tax=Penicillium antarcticum TaxID=416450 RepID=UPI00238D9D6D|nr:uncharacterized protein N7508_007151 [Penicillium antarcticum]KAJ5302288.1 hypothetical protein N7508_007151 [Penicillium antarcticum]